jgi:hypothetical protein
VGVGEDLSFSPSAAVAYHPRREPLLLFICFSSEKGPFLGDRGAYSLKCVEQEFCEVRIAPVHYRMGYRRFSHIAQ